MATTVSLTQTQIFTALVTVLGTFGLVTDADVAVPIVRGQVNRVPEPNGRDFIVLWPIMRDRLAMNIDIWDDAAMLASITSNVMTVTSVLDGQVRPGRIIFGPGVTSGARVIAQLTGTPGGIGTYSTTAAADVTSRKLAFGEMGAMQETEITVQADVHGPASADNAARLSTLFRDQFGIDAFREHGIGIGLFHIGIDAIGGTPLTPLYTSEPRQIPFDNGEQQVEERWVVDLCMQADVTISFSAQYADDLEVTTTPVETLPVA